MKPSSIIIIILLLVIIAMIAIFAFDIGRTAPLPYLSIASYAECVGAGYPSLESYPAECKTPDGRTFTETVSTTTDPTPHPSPSPSPTGSSTKPVVVTSTIINVTSPLVVTGTITNVWIFEAQTSFEVDDAHGAILGQATIHTSGDWTVSGQVPFETTISFSTSTTATGALVFHKDNPSGLPANDQSFSVPITFKLK